MATAAPPLPFSSLYGDATHWANPTPAFATLAFNFGANAGEGASLSMVCCAGLAQASTLSPLVVAFVSNAECDTCCSEYCSALVTRHGGAPSVPCVPLRTPPWRGSSCQQHMWLPCDGVVACGGRVLGFVIGQPTRKLHFVELLQHLCPCSLRQNSCRAHGHLPFGKLVVSSLHEPGWRSYGSQHWPDAFHHSHAHGKGYIPRQSGGGLPTCAYRVGRTLPDHCCVRSPMASLRSGPPS
jgi:hypothetical protein